MNKNNEIIKIKEAGVVGAGGAGFPSYFKYNANCEYLLINGAECEPLLYKDKDLMRLYSEQLAEGMNYLAELTNAKKAIIGLKAKNEDALKNFDSIFKKYKGKLEYFVLKDFYPAGDEVVLVYEILKRVVPPAGLPLDVGAIVTNPETILNVFNKIKNNQNVTETFITVAGAVKKPFTAKVPVGISFKEAIDFAGGVTVSDPVFIDGGPMMGFAVSDINNIITKTCAGFIVLDKSHPLALKKFMPDTQLSTIGRSCCDQCSYCTEFCPRYLLGHPLMPHRAMRTLGMSKDYKDIESQWALVCVECGLCGLFACPEDLLPNKVCTISKRNLAAKGIRFNKEDKEYKPHPIREARRVPISRLVKKLALEEYNVHPDFVDYNVKTKQVKIPLQQHIGVPCSPIVKKGEKVTKGQIIGTVDDSKMGAFIHSSINGKVKDITDKYILISI
jgi:Na+-translocating ferredoxin:NAD+ oxidoreductase RnfC subunit